MVFLHFMYTLLEMVRLGGFLVFIRTLYDNIWNYIFILINANIFLLLFAKLVCPKANEMLQPSLKKKKSYSTQKVVSITPSTSTFEMIKKYNTYNKYEFVQDWYIQIEAPKNMFPDTYLFGSIDGNEPEILGIIINCYAYNENDIDFQVEMIKENEVILISCQVQYTNFRLDLIEASSTDSTNIIKNSMLKLDNFESFSKSGLNSCANLLKCIATILRYFFLRSKKTSSVLLHLQQKGKFLNKIQDDKIDSQLFSLKRVYLSDWRRT